VDIRKVDYGTERQVSIVGRKEGSEGTFQKETDHHLFGDVGVRAGKCPQSRRATESGSCFGKPDISGTHQAGKRQGWIHSVSAGRVDHRIEGARL